MLIIVGIPSLSVATWVVKDRIEQTLLFHSNSWAANMNRVADLLSVSEKAIADGVQDTSNLRNPLLPSDIINEPFETNVVKFTLSDAGQSASSAGAVAHESPQNPELQPATQKSSSMPELAPLTFTQNLQSFILKGLVSCSFIVVVDPTDVRGLEAIGMGVANTFSRSLHASGNSVSFNTNAEPPSGMNSAYEPPVYTGDTDYTSPVVSPSRPALSPAV
jgi:hypothetical protein